MITSPQIEHLDEKFKDLLFLDANRLAPRLRNFADTVERKGGEIRHVWAFIDGTVRPTCRSSGGLKQLYNGHKRKHATKFQTLSTPDGIISHVYGGIEGRCHDITLLRRSGLQAALESNDRFRGFFIFGDPAYGNYQQLPQILSLTQYVFRDHIAVSTLRRSEISYQTNQTQDVLSG